MKKNTLSSRAIASRVLVAVVYEGRAFHPKMVQTFMPKPDAREESFIAYLCFGVLRYYPYLQRKMQRLLQKPLKAKDHDLELLILIGLYQLHFSDTPKYASISGTVDAASSLNKPWAKGLINGVLRQTQREIEANSVESSKDIAYLAHPKWLIKKIDAAWSLEASSLLEANMEHPPLVLRLNTQKTTIRDYLALLHEKGIEASALHYPPEALVLKTGIHVESLPHFFDGWVSVQDTAAQLVPECLPLPPHGRVLDACAAPGGKAAHLLEQNPSLQLIAIEKDPVRFVRLQETMARTSHQATLLCKDAAEIATWWDGIPFDGILLDAPCSATGILRRHPDIKLHRNPNDIEQLTQVQASLLDALWPLLKPNGILLYVTCSVLPEENVEQMIGFLGRHTDAQEWPIKGDWGMAQAVGRQILPGQSIMDGFYYARIRKHG